MKEICDCDICGSLMSSLFSTQTWCVVGSYTWLVHLVGTPGLYTWFEHLVRTPGSYPWFIHLVGTPGWYTWLVHLTPGADVYRTDSLQKVRTACVSLHVMKECSGLHTEYILYCPVVKRLPCTPPTSHSSRSQPQREDKRL